MTTKQISDLIRQNLCPGKDRGSYQAIIDTRDIKTAAEAISTKLQKERRQRKFSKLPSFNYSLNTLKS